MNLTYFCHKMRGNVEKTNNNPVNIRFVDKTPDIRNLSENITSNVMLIYQNIIKSMFGYTQYQAYGLSQTIPTLWSITSNTAPISVYMHMDNVSVCKVCTTRQAQSHTHTFLAFTYNPSTTSGSGS